MRELVESIMLKAEETMVNDPDEYTRELLQIARDNDIWTTKVVALALMFSTNRESCKSIETMLDWQEYHVVDKHGNRINEFKDEEITYVNLLLNSNIYDRYKNNLN